MSKAKKDNDSEFLELSAKLTKAEKKKINNQIAEERVEQDGTVRKLGNIAERAVSILGGTGNNIPYVSSVDSQRFIELAKKELDNRKGKNMGGILQDERIGYADGTPDDKLLGHIEEVTDEMRDELLNNNRKTKEFVTKEYGLDPDGLEMEIRNFQEKEEKKEDKKMYEGGRVQAAEGFPDLNKDGKTTYADVLKGRGVFQEGGDIDGQMSMLMMTKEPEEEMLPDDEMEDEYLDFILDEALDSEEEDYLMSQLQSNERLSEIFDKVIDIAQEFAGSGPVEGPGSGVSDSIPARLSDGEFVFTAKAVEEIGADNLMAMMKDAETKADDRQGLANGGEPEEEDTVEMPVEKPATKQDIRVVKTTVDNGGKGLLDEDEISKSIKSKMMLDNRTGRHVQS